MATREQGPGPASERVAEAAESVRLRPESEARRPGRSRSVFRSMAGNSDGASVRSNSFVVLLDRPVVEAPSTSEDGPACVTASDVIDSDPGSFWYLSLWWWVGPESDKSLQVPSRPEGRPQGGYTPDIGLLRPTGLVPEGVMGVTGTSRFLELLLFAAGLTRTFVQAPGGHRQQALDGHQVYPE